MIIKSIPSRLLVRLLMMLVIRHNWLLQADSTYKHIIYLRNPGFLQDEFLLINTSEIDLNRLPGRGTGIEILHRFALVEGAGFYLHDGEHTAGPSCTGVKHAEPRSL